MAGLHAFEELERSGTLLDVLVTQRERFTKTHRVEREALRKDRPPVDRERLFPNLLDDLPHSHLEIIVGSAIDQIGTSIEVALTRECVALIAHVLEQDRQLDVLTFTVAQDPSLRDFEDTDRTEHRCETEHHVHGPQLASDQQLVPPTRDSFQCEVLTTWMACDGSQYIRTIGPEPARA